MGITLVEKHNDNDIVFLKRKNNDNDIVRMTNSTKKGGRHAC